MSSRGMPGQPERFGSPGAILRRIERLNQDIRELGPSIAKSFQGTVATLQQAVDDVAQAQDTLTDQQATLTTQQATLTTQQATLTTQQGELEAAQDTLTSQQAELDNHQDEIDNTVQLLGRIDDDAERDQTSGWSITTTMTTRAQEIYTVPNYPCRVTVIALGMANGWNDSGGPDTLSMDVEIAFQGGGTGRSIQGIQTIPDGQGAGVGATYASDSIDFEGGETITIRGRVGTFSDTWPAHAQNSCQVVFVANVYPLVN